MLLRVMRQIRTKNLQMLIQRTKFLKESQLKTHQVLECFKIADKIEQFVTLKKNSPKWLQTEKLVPKLLLLQNQRLKKYLSMNHLMLNLWEKVLGSEEKNLKIYYLTHKLPL